MKYLFSVIDPLNTDFLCSKLTGLEDVPLILMATTEAVQRYVFRAGPFANGSYLFKDSSHFKAAGSLLNLFLIRPIFSIRALCNEKNILLLRIHSVCSNVKELDNTTREGLLNRPQVTRTFLVNEQQLDSYLSSVRYVREPMSNFAGNINDLVALGVSAPPRVRRNGDTRFIIPPRRSLSIEQRADAQSVLDIMISSKRASVSFSLNSRIPISSSLDYDMTSKIFTGIPPEEDPVVWKPNGGVLQYTKGGGRRRVIAAVADSVCHFENNERDSIFASDKYRASKVFVIVSPLTSFGEWCNEFELTNTAVFQIRNASDLNIVTFAAVDEGAVILVAKEIFETDDILNDRLVEDALGIIHSAVLSHDIATRLHGAGAREMDKQRCQKMLVNSFGIRFPKSPVPLSLLAVRGILVDECELSEIEILPRIDACFKSDWKWITVGYDGQPPLFVDQKIINFTKNFIGVPQKQLPEAEIWRLYSESTSGICSYLRTPRAILKKVSLISIPCGPSHLESTFFTILGRVKQSQSSIPTRIEESETSEMLVGSDLNGVGGCNLRLVLPRLGDMSPDEALNNCAAHFSFGPGTIAQRIGKAEGNSVTSLAESKFATRSLQEIRSLICQVCMSDPASCVTLCGHVFCADCTVQINAPTTPTIQCPVCRAQICKYDWIRVKTDNDTFVEKEIPSKIRGILDALDNIFGRRRHKRRYGMRAWVVAPAGTIASLKSIIQNDRPRIEIYDDNAILSNPLNHKVKILSFEEFDQNLTDDFKFGDENIEAVVLAMPLKNDYYHKLIKASNRRLISLQVHVLHAAGIESMEETNDIFR